MTSQNDKEGLGHVKAAYITGIFAVIAACIAGFFLVINTMVNNGIIVLGTSKSNPQETASSSSNANNSPANQSMVQPTVIATEQLSNPNNILSDYKWTCVQKADSSQKSTWETCWRYIQIDNAGGITEASKENANAIEWIGPTDLSYTTIGQYHSDYISEWYAWVLQKNRVRFCIDVDSKVQVEGKVESISAGCYLWQRGAFMVEMP